MTYDFTETLQLFIDTVCIHMPTSPTSCALQNISAVLPHVDVRFALLMVPSYALKFFFFFSISSDTTNQFLHLQVLTRIISLAQYTVYAPALAQRGEISCVTEVLCLVLHIFSRPEKLI